MQIVTFLYYLMIFIWILPSGSIFGIPIKIPLFLITIIIMAAFIIEKKMQFHFSRPMFFLLPIGAGIVVWSVLSIVNGYDDGMLSFMKAFISLMSVIVLTDIFFLNFAGQGEEKRTVRLLYVSAVVFVACKLLIEVLFILKILSYDACYSLFTNIFNATTMTVEFNIGPFLCCRFSTANDFIPIVILGLYLIQENKKHLLKIAVICIMVLYAVVVYSRVVFLHLAIVLVAVFAVNCLKFGKRYLVVGVIAALLVVAVLLLLIIVTYGSKGGIYQAIYSFVEERFFGKQVEYSDSFRTIQAEYLWDGFKQSPVFGHGLGAYVRECIRSVENPHSYELEWLAMLYQFGIVGFVLIICGLIAVFTFWVIDKECDKYAKFIIIVNLLMWIVKPLFNPHFLSSASGMTMVILFVFASYYKNSEREKSR